MAAHLRPLALLSLAAAAGCLPTTDGGNPDLSGQTVRLTVLHTADIHSRLIPYDLAPLKTDVDLGLAAEAAPYGGATRLAALIKRERARSDRAIHVDSGDCFQGAPVFNANNGEVETRFLSMLNPDAVVIGNHEFDAGAPNFAYQAERWAMYPLLAANYRWQDYRDPVWTQLGRISVPYTIVNAKGVRIGIIGMANLSSLNSIVDGGNSMGVTPLEQNETARSFVELLKPVTDLIMVVSHLGLTEDQELITGYEAYFPKQNVAAFVDGRAEDDPSRWQVQEELPDGTVRVFIPGVRGIDVIMGGHLHVVLNPSQEIQETPTPADPPGWRGRKVVLQHSGAFAKYLGRLDLALQFPTSDDSPERQAERAEVVTHDYHPFPVDAIWCDDEARSWRQQLSSEVFKKALVPRVKACIDQEDREMTNLMLPYVQGLDTRLALPRVFAFAPKDIARRNSSTGGDSPLGNLTAESMRVRRRVEAELSLTNTLGIRDNLYAGPVNLESMFNVFPFENTINIMYLSGREVQELFDFVAEKSADRGCQSQAQVSGTKFVMDCDQAIQNRRRFACQAASDCETASMAAGYGDRSGGRAQWECTIENVCYAHPTYGISINGKPLVPDAEYKVAVNDYIARGGSGFKVLKRNTTRIETGISLRDSLIDYLRGMCTCGDILAGKPRSSAGLACATAHLQGGGLAVDDAVLGYCKAARQFEEWLAARPPVPFSATDPSMPSLSAGRCGCGDVLAGNEELCGHITSDVLGFCRHPTGIPIAVAEEDGRIGRRVK